MGSLCRNLDLGNTAGANTHENTSGLVYSGDMGGKWYDIILGDYSGMNMAGSGYDIVGIFDGIKGGNKVFGMDNGNYQFNGIIRNFICGNNFIGCLMWSSDIGPAAIIENGVCGANSIAIGRKISSGAVIRNVSAGNVSFGGKTIGVKAAEFGSGTGDSATLTFTAGPIHGYLYGLWPVKRPSRTLCVAGRYKCDRWLLYCFRY